MRLHLLCLGLSFAMLFVGVAPVHAGETCQRVFDSSLSPKAIQALQDLFQFTAGYDQHSVKVIDGKGYVKIDRLVRDQSTFKRLLFRAIKLGAIAEVDAGMVAGPKVLTLLNHIKRVEPATGESIRFHGYMNPSGLLGTLKRQLDEMEYGTGPGGAWNWTATDIVDFHKAVKEFELEKVCHGIFGVALKYCGFMNFEFNSGPDDIRWEKRQ